ncbi:FimV/HubP family polar landmark protein [Chitinimonas naiadis]
MGALLSQPALSATLGPLQINSRIGQTLDARVRINAHADEYIGRDCIAASLYDGGDDGYLKRVLTEFAADKSGGGWLTLIGDGALNEPIAKLSIRMRCGDGGEAKRDYIFLLDPPERLADRTASAESGLPQSRAGNGATSAGPNASGNGIVAPLPASQGKRNTSARPDDGANPLAAYGGTWVSKAGETYASIAARIFPGQPDTQKALVLQLRQLNAHLPPRGKKPLADGVQLRLPEKLKAPKPATKPPAFASSKPAPVPMPAPAAPAAPAAAAANPNAAAQSKPGTLKLSGTEPEAAAGSTATPTEQEAFKEKERELLDQAAEQLARLHESQNRIDKLEKRLAWLSNEMLRRDTANAAALKAQGQANWSSLGLAALLGAIVASALAFLLHLLSKRRQQRSQQTETLAAAFNDGHDDLPWHEQTIIQPRAEINPGQPVAPQPVLQQAHFEAPAHSPQESDMDVFILNSAASEAAVLAAHGQYDRAIAMLEEEIQIYPTSVVNWMQLLELLYGHRDTERFLALAQDFRQRFASEALWEKVRQMGLSLIPDHPLFSILEAPFGKPMSDLNSVLDADLEPDPVPASADHLAEPLVFELDKSITAVGAPPQHLDLIEIPAAFEDEPHGDLILAPVEPATPLEQARHLIAGGEREAGAAILEKILMQGSQEEKLAAADLLVRLTSPS